MFCRVNCLISTQKKNGSLHYIAIAIFVLFVYILGIRFHYVWAPLLLLLLLLNANRRQLTMNKQLQYDLKRKQYHRRRSGICIIPPI